MLELRVPAGQVCLHYAGKHRDYGDGIFVGPRTFSTQPDISSDLFNSAYFTFYPATAALTNQLVSVVGNVGTPSIPSRLRRAGAREGRLVKTWNHELLLQRISEGWRPEMEVS